MPPKTLTECQELGLDAKRVLADAVDLVLRCEPLPAIAPLICDLLTNESVPPQEARRAIRVVARLRVLGTVLPGIEPSLVLGFDRLLRLGRADAALLQLWFELVSDIAPTTIATLRRVTLAHDLPNSLDAWAMNRVAAWMLLASPRWAAQLEPAEATRLKLLASEDIEDRWKAMLDVGELRIPVAQMDAWLTADTPRPRWSAMSERRSAQPRPKLVLGPFTDELGAPTVPRRVRQRLDAAKLSDERLSEVAQPPDWVLRRGRRCPDCRSTDHVHWFYSCSPPATWAAMCGRELWFSVCLQCRVRLAAVRVSMS